MNRSLRMLFILSACLHNKNIASGQRVGSRVEVGADGVVWHNPEETDSPLVSATCTRAALNAAKK